MFKAAIFDLDGTLLDSFLDLENACNYALSKFNLPKVNSQSYKLMLGESRKIIIKSIINDLIGNVDEKTYIEFHEHYNNYYNEHMLDNTKPYDGILEMLVHLKNNGVITAILSNKPHGFTNSLAKHYFGDKIDVVYGLRDGYEPKPNPDTLLELIKHLNIDRKDCIYIGDTEVDIEVAQNAHIESLGVLWGFRNKALLEKTGADFLASNTDELLEIVLN